MKKHITPLLITAFVFSTILGCGGLLPSPPAAALMPQSTLLPAPDPCLPPAVEHSEITPTCMPPTALCSTGFCSQSFLPLIILGAPLTTFCPAIQHGLTFLMSRYNTALGLLNEAPLAAPHKYWLTNDNALAAYAFARLEQTGMSATLKESILRYGSDTNGLIEVVWGVPVVFPPYNATPTMIVKVGEDEIYQEYHDQGPILEDWKDYANLGFLGALNAYHRGEAADALSIYAATLDQFDGIGFHDKAFGDRYETYKLALALYVGAVIQAPNAYRNQMLSTMLSMQDLNGGFCTHYRDPLTPEGDTNTETSALALLALKAYGCNLP